MRRPSVPLINAATRIATKSLLQGRAHQSARGQALHYLRRRHRNRPTSLPQSRVSTLVSAVRAR